MSYSALEKRTGTLGTNGPQGASHGGSEKSGKLEVGGASRDSTGFGVLEGALGKLWNSLILVFYP